MPITSDYLICVLILDLLINYMACYINVTLWLCNPEWRTVRDREIDPIYSDAIIIHFSVLWLSFTTSVTIYLDIHTAQM
jgi:hypothetical protein